jgi:1-acyl-sn-glycerol-3-phosphate acyltransferase
VSTARAPAQREITIGGRIRITLRLLAMLALLVISVTGYYLHKPFSRHNPWPRRFLGGVARLAGVRTKRVGEPRRGGAFLLSNHVSWIDIPAIAGATGSAFVAHDGLAGHRFMRWLCEMNDTVFVARHDRRSVARQVEQVREAIRDTGTLTIFPEGTTSDGSGLLPFKSSLLSALDPVPDGIVVQPVWLDFGPETTAIAWVDDEPGTANFFRILARQRPLDLTVHFLAPLAGEELANRKAMAAAGRRAIAAAMATADDQRVAL